jgi:hypothetical protein
MRLRDGIAAAAALVVVVWFGLGAVQARDLSRATAALSTDAHISPKQAAEIRGWIDGARALNPDRTITLLRGQLLTAEGHLAAARQVIGAVTRAEPENLEAWVAMAGASRDDPREFSLTLQRVRSLEPLLPGETPPHRHHP